MCETKNIEKVHRGKRGVEGVWRCGWVEVMVELGGG